MIFSPQIMDMDELKAILEISSTSQAEDVKLLFYVEYASDIIAEVLDRPGLWSKARTEYYNGTGTQKLLLKSRPVLTSPTILVREDESGFFGSASGTFGTDTALTYGEDFHLWIDQDDGSSRCGILLRDGDFWPRPASRQTGLLSPFLGEGFGNIRVIYTGGYTLDTLPGAFRLAAALLIARLRLIFPLGVILSSENYEDRGVSYSIPDRNKLLEMVKPLVFSYRNWKF
jgi:hypothetical protein